MTEPAPLPDIDPVADEITPRLCPSCATLFGVREVRRNGGQG
jgi:hypothetical protein